MFIDKLSRNKMMKYQLKLISCYFLAINLILYYFSNEIMAQNMEQNSVEQGIEQALIPRQVIFGNPDRAGVKISHDGKYISYVAPYNGVLNIYVAPINNLKKAYVITNDTKRGIRAYIWSYNNKNIIYAQDNNGDENWHLYSVNIETKEHRDLTPFSDVLSEINNINIDFPNEILVSINKRRKDYHDLYKISVVTGEMKLLYENNEYGSLVTDNAFKIRFGNKELPSGDVVIDEFLFAGKGKYTTKEFMLIPFDDAHTTDILGFNKNNNIVYLKSSLNRNTGALYAYDCDKKEQELIYSNPKADVETIVGNAQTKELQAVSYDYLKPTWHVLDSNVKEDFEKLESFNEGILNITSKSSDDNIWIVAYNNDNSPLKYYIYNKTDKSISYLFSNKESLNKYKLNKMSPVVIKSRDDLDLVSYLTIPTNNNKPYPMVLLVHGGPTARDVWGLDMQHQWLSNRGYAVLSVNYRGSSGFGKSFINSGNGEWAGKMHDDLIDAVNWAIENKIADPNKIAIMGGSYGGYATLVGLTFTPGVFACGIDIVGPSNLATLLDSIPPYWAPFRASLVKKLGGDSKTEEGQKILNSKSPLSYINNIQKPLLIGQGANDPRVKQAESDQIVKAMNNKKIPVTYILYDDEGHGFARPDNRIYFYAITEQFLAANLGGSKEKIHGDEINKSSAKIVHGKEFLPQ